LKQDVPDSRVLSLSGFVQFSHFPTLSFYPHMLAQLLTVYRDYFPVAKLILCGLTGAMACFLTPLFIFKAWKDRRKIYYLHAMIMIAAVIIQASAYVNSSSDDPAMQRRFIDIDPDISAVGLVSFNMVSPVFSWPAGSGIFGEYKKQRSSLDNFPIWQIIFSVAMLIMFFVTIRYFSASLSTKQKVDFACGFLLMAILSTAFSAHVQSQTRYGYAPSVILTLMILQNVNFNHQIVSKLKQKLAFGIIIFSIISHFVIFFIPIPNFTVEDNWPKWKNEVIEWKKDNKRPITIYPPFWQFELDIRPSAQKTH